MSKHTRWYMGADGPFLQSNIKYPGSFYFASTNKESRTDKT